MRFEYSQNILMKIILISFFNAGKIKYTTIRYLALALIKITFNQF